MSVKITNPDSFAPTGDPDLANGTFEFYAAGTDIRRFAGINRQMTELAPFQNVLNGQSLPIQNLWVDSIAALDVVFRNHEGAELSRGALSESITALNPIAALAGRVTAIEQA